MHEPVKCPVRVGRKAECGRPAIPDNHVILTDRGPRIHYDCGLHKLHGPVTGKLQHEPCDC
jgi:hypothetical protein